MLETTSTTIETGAPRALRSGTALLALVALTTLGGCANVGIGIGIPLFPHLGLGVGLNSSGPSVGLSGGWGGLGTSVGLNSRGQVSGGVGVGTTSGNVSVGVGTSTVLYDPNAPVAARPRPSGAEPGVVVGAPR